MYLDYVPVVSNLRAKLSLCTIVYILRRVLCLSRIAHLKFLICINKILIYEGKLALFCLKMGTRKKRLNKEYLFFFCNLTAQPCATQKQMYYLFFLVCTLPLIICDKIKHKCIFINNTLLEAQTINYELLKQKPLSHVCIMLFYIFGISVKCKYNTTIYYSSLR